MEEEFESKYTTPTVETSSSLEERLASKNWSHRASAFEELGASFKAANSSKDDVFKEYAD